MKPGHFHASCKLDKNAGKSPYPGPDHCDVEFTDRDTYVEHFRAEHPDRYRERPKSPVMSGPRKQPWGRPAVKLEKQAIPPGTHFTHHGYSCQVVGAVSATRTRFLAWFPEDFTPNNRTAVRVVGGTDPVTGLVMWELTAPTQAVKEVVDACAT